jgi:hypothetical protein
VAVDQELAEELARIANFTAEIHAENEVAFSKEVKDFRETLPGGKVLDEAGARKWLRSHRAKRGTGMRQMLPQEFQGMDSSGKIRPHLKPSTPKLETIWLEVVIVNREGFGRSRTELPRIEFTEDSAAGDLAARAEVLHQRYGWDRPSAAGWLLTGSPPDPPTITSTRKAARRVIEIPSDIPLSLIPRLINTGFGEYLVSRRGPRLSHKVLEVCTFGVRHKGGRTWTEVMQKWNAIAPDDWQYSGTDARRHFARDVRDTYEKLSGEDSDWRR